MTASTILLAGAAGDLGGRIATALVARGATVRALVRTDSPTVDRERVAALGATLVEADVWDATSTATACAGADCVVSALNGLRSVILDRQSVLLDAAVRAGVPRFIPSDYSEDYTTTAPGGNRNLDLRREFAGRADRASIGVTSVLNGAFLDMLGAEFPILQPKIRRVLHWGDVDQPLDFTTKDDVAAVTAAVALDPAPTPRYLRFAGGSVSARELAVIMTEVSGERYRTLRAGGVGALGVLIGVAQRVAPQAGEVFPVWQGMQYMRDMFSGAGHLTALDHARYPDLTWTSVPDHLRTVVARG